MVTSSDDLSPSDKGVKQQAAAHSALGDALVHTGHLDAAIESYGRALALRPDTARFHTALGRALFRQGKLDESEAAARRALAIDPELAEAHSRLGKISLRRNRIADAFECFTQGAQLFHERPNPETGDREPVIDHKSRHDREQREYLSSIGIQPDGSGHLFHLASDDGRELNRSALGLANAAPAISRQWREGSPKIVVLDDFLSDEALTKLRQFCWASTVWENVYERGYLEAYLNSGISCPLLGQIADELRLRYPDVFGDMPLWLFWGFKYDSQLAGVGIHADIATVNVNFWITPDDANLDPDSGGLIIWDTPPPDDWSATKFNSGDTDPARDFLESCGAQSVAVPYRSNRAVIFDSSLFHATDEIRFKEGYLNRRINITLLYGRRAPAAG